jgi:peroxiredoxin Q/BCP
MRRLLPALAFAALMTVPALAQLDVGSAAPDFETEATLGGNEFTFKLSDALAKGPVVLYFYPAAFTPGCTAEAHDFAEATADFAALNATVIGVSADDIATLNKFSVEACRSKFAVASDKDQAIMKSYDAVLDKKPEVANRTSYVISPEGMVVYAYTALDYADHVKNTLDAVKAWKAEQP